MTQDTQTPQPQWQWTKHFAGYSVTNERRSGDQVPGYFVCTDEESARIACQGLNAQQHRIEQLERERDVTIGQSVEWFQKAEQGYRFVKAATQRIELLEAALREAQMHIRADCPACKAGYPRIVTEGGHGSKFTTHPMTYEQSLALEEHLTYFLDTGYVFCSAGWAQWEKDFLTKLNALLSPSEAI